MSFTDTRLVDNGRTISYSVDVSTPLLALSGDLETTDRTLRRCVEQGLIRARRPSPRKLELSPAERVYLRANWPTLERLRSALRTEPKVRLAILFGSRARGDHRADSDVDLVVELDNPSQRHRLSERLEAALGLRVQLALLEDAEGAPLLLEQVLEEGRVVVDRGQRWRAIIARSDAIARAANRERERVRTEVDELVGSAA